MITWSLGEITLPLRFTWKISRNSSTEKKNFFVGASENEHKGVGEVAPNIRYGETEEIIRNQFSLFLERVEPNISSLAELTILLDSLNLVHSLRFGIESAFVHLVCEKETITPANYFNLILPESVSTSFSIPIIEIGQIKEFIQPLKHFKSLKIKVNSENALDMVSEVVKNTDQKIRIDGNEAWTDVEELIIFIENVSKFNVEFIEQPMPSNLVSEYQLLKRYSPFDLIADESIEDDANFDLIKTQFHGINMKLMKAGGYKNGIRLLAEARKHNLKTMIGCMVETSLGIYSAYNLAHQVDYLDLDGFLIIKDDPFGLLYEEDGLLYLN